jgi:hypothetical protein
MHKRPAIPWATAVQVRPILPAQPAAVADIPEDQVPDLRPEGPAFPLRLATAHTVPPRPRGIPPPSVNAGSDGEKSGGSLLVPQLTAAESAAAQQETNRSLTTAEKNLESTRGKRLNAAQADLVSKINGFIKDAREAVQSADWARARTLSKKAQVLSEELAAAL